MTLLSAADKIARTMSKTIKICSSLVVCLFVTPGLFAQQDLCVAGQRVLVGPQSHPATVLASSGASCRLHYEDGAYPDGWDYKFNLKPANGSGQNANSATPPAQPDPCVPGNRVLAGAQNHHAIVLASSGASCRLHYEDGAYPDGWDYKFNIKPIAGGPKASASMATTPPKGPRMGRYNITAGAGFSNGYLVLSSPSEYELFLPGGTSAGKGKYAFDSAGSRMRWISGPLTNPVWNGTQKLELEADEETQKIRIGERAVATNTGK